MSIRVMIVDDERLARQSIRRFLNNHPDMQVLEECGDGQSAVSAIQAHRPDLLFLDVQMPELDGFGVVNRIGAEHMPATIFVTAYDQYALRAFDAQALDYLLKPFSKTVSTVPLPVRASAFRTCRSRLHATASSHHGKRRPTENLYRSFAGYRKRSHRFCQNKAHQWIESAGNYARLHIPSGIHDIRETLTSLEGKLNPQEFVRIHRSTIVNLHYVKEVHPWFHGYHLVLLENGQQLRMSRYQQQVAARLGLR